MSQPPVDPHDAPTRFGAGPPPPPPARPTPYPPPQQGWPQQPGWGPPVLPPPAPRRSRAPWALGALALVLLAAGGGLAAFLLVDDDGDGDRPSASGSAEPDPTATAPTATAPTPSAATVTPARPVTASAVMGSWTGTYTCTQGPSAMDLVVYDAGGGRLDARMTFGPTPENPAVASGSFGMEGTLEDGVLALAGSEWIDQPDGYGFVDLSATIDDPAPSEISGTVETAGCSTFTITR